MVSIERAEVEFLLHSTEDLGVIKKIAKVLGIEDVEILKLVGHYGNPIIRSRSTLTGKKAERLFHSILSELNVDNKASLVWDLESSVDEKCHFFLRLDKQKMSDGILELGESDAVRIKFLFKGERKEVVEWIRRWL